MGFSDVGVFEQAPLMPSKQIRDRILFYANRRAKPFYLGFLANDIGWSLVRTDRYVQQLVIEGILRKLQADELTWATSNDAQVYVIVDLDVSAAHLP